MILKKTIGACGIALLLIASATAALSSFTTMSPG